MKKILSLTLALLMILACTPIVMAEENVQNTDGVAFEYQVMSDGTIVLKKYTGTAIDVIIPEEYQGYKVTWIMDGAFKSNKIIKSVHIPKSITFIAEAVFADCDNLTKFTTDNSIYGTTGTILYRKDNNRIIGYACGAKTSTLTIPSNIQTIAPCSFWGADNLKTVITNKGLKEIGYSAFKDCENLKSIYVVDDETFVDGYLFDGVTDKTVIYYNGYIEMQAGKVPCKIMPYTAGMENPTTTTTTEKTKETTTKPATTKPSTTKAEKTTVADGTTESTTETTTFVEQTTESTTLKETEVNANVDSEKTETTGNDKNKATPIIIGVVVVAVAGAVATGVTVTMKKKKK